MLTIQEFYRLVLPYIGSSFSYGGESPRPFLSPLDLDLSVDKGGLDIGKFKLHLTPIDQISDPHLEALARGSVNLHFVDLTGGWTIKRIRDGVDRIKAFKIVAPDAFEDGVSHQVYFDIQDDFDLTWWKMYPDGHQGLCGNFDAWSWYGKLAQWGYDRPVFVAEQHPLNGKNLQQIGLAAKLKQHVG